MITRLCVITTWLILSVALTSCDFICEHIYPSAYTETERKFWNDIAGCEERRAIVQANLNSQLRIAVGLGQADTVKILLKQGADVNSRATSTDNVPVG